MAEARFLQLNDALGRTPAPGIAEINALAGALRRKGETLINLGQAVPFFPPPAEALARLSGNLSEPGLHCYTPDPGLPELREKWSRLLRERFRLPCDPERHLLITAGANQAYLMAVMSLLNPGDRMGLPTPWYFNHAMAVSMIGAEPVPIAFSAEGGYHLDVDLVAKTARDQRLKAVTIVTTNNPTGTTYRPDDLRRLARELLTMGVFLIVDETYALFPTPGESHFSCGSLEAASLGIITIGSFSKCFALTGWRVGWIVASEALTAQMLKVQDTMVICAPHAGQHLVLHCLPLLDTWLPEKIAQLATRRERFLAMAERFRPWRVRSCGLFFAFLEGPEPGRKKVLEILENDRVILIPGDIFGPGKGVADGLDTTIRVSLGGAPEQDLAEGLERLARRLGR